jgi:hypothetical protein
MACHRNVAVFDQHVSGFPTKNRIVLVVYGQSTSNMDDKIDQLDDRVPLYSGLYKLDDINLQITSHIKKHRARDTDRAFSRSWLAVLRIIASITTFLRDYQTVRFSSSAQVTYKYEIPLTRASFIWVPLPTLALPVASHQSSHLRYTF